MNSALGVGIKKKKSSQKRVCVKMQTQSKQSFYVCLAKIIFASLFYYSAYFCYYSWTPLHFLVLFMNLTILFQLTFTFIYSTFSKKIFSFSKIS